MITTTRATIALLATKTDVPMMTVAVHTRDMTHVDVRVRHINMAAHLRHPDLTVTFHRVTTEPCSHHVTMGESNTEAATQTDQATTSPSAARLIRICTGQVVQKRVSLSARQVHRHRASHLSNSHRHSNVAALRMIKARRVIKAAHSSP